MTTRPGTNAGQDEPCPTTRVTRTLPIPTKSSPPAIAKRGLSWTSLPPAAETAKEVAASGKVAGALNVSRGMLEFRADPESPYHDKNFDKSKSVILYCASGGRSALAGKALKDMGYEKVYNVGGFKDWTGAVEK